MVSGRALDGSVAPAAHTALHSARVANTAQPCKKAASASVGSSASQLVNASQDARSSRPRAGSAGVAAAGSEIVSVGSGATGAAATGALQTAQISHAGHLATGGGGGGVLAQLANNAVPATAIEMRKCEWLPRIGCSCEICVGVIVPRVYQSRRAVPIGGIMLQCKSGLDMGEANGVGIRSGIFSLRAGGVYRLVDVSEK